VPASRKVDPAQTAEVTALIEQRLKILDQGADHFALIGIGRDASTADIRSAYFALARQLHPDRLLSLGIADTERRAQRLFAEVNTAFSIISDPDRRRDYLDVLSRGGAAAIREEQARAEELAQRILESEDAFTRGEMALRRGALMQAVQELERAVQLNPDEAEYIATLAWAQFCLAPDKTAVSAQTRHALDRAIKTAPKSIPPKFYLGRVERMLGRDQEALRLFRDVLALQPSHTEAASEVRVLEQRLGGTQRR
jgi:tetratricopeptide (TPR) repeat protein